MLGVLCGCVVYVHYFTCHFEDVTFLSSKFVFVMIMEQHLNTLLYGIDHGDLELEVS